MKRVLLTGGTSALAALTGQTLVNHGYEILMISSSHDNFELRCDFTTVDGIRRLYGILESFNPERIVHCASLYKGEYSSSSVEDLLKWTNFLGAAQVIAKYCIEHKTKTRAIMVGSIAGVSGKFIKGLSLYGQYKASLQSITEAAHIEGADIRYINLGSFRDDGDGFSAIRTRQVANCIRDLCIEEECHEEIIINLMPKNELSMQCSGRLWRR